MLTLTQILVLAVVQGIAEFLPISSSGHLVIVAALLHPTGDLEDLSVADVNIVLHGGTLLSIVVFYWGRIWRLLGEDRRTVGLLLVGTLPAIAIGLPLKAYAEKVLENPLLAGFLLPVTGAVLLAISRKQPRDVEYPALGYGRAFLVGISQAAALLPGLSRSGLTISAGLAVGLSRRSAATFSFLLALPAIGGACAYQMVQLMDATQVVTPVGHLAMGAAVSFVVGLVSLWWVVKWLEQGRLQYFAYWCIAVGLAVIIWQLIKIYS